MEPRVALLSSTAEEFISCEDEFDFSSHFWSSLNKQSAELTNPTVLRAVPFHEIHPDKLEANGFVPFCKIEEMRLYLKIQGNEREMVILENGFAWDFKDWGTGQELRVKLMAEFFYRVIFDDFKIDSAEARVLHALFRCIGPLSHEISEAKSMLYMSLIQQVMEDGIITESEKDIVSRIHSILELTETECDGIHRNSVKERFSELFCRVSEDQIQASDIKGIVEMGKALGLTQETIFELSEKAGVELSERAETPKL